MGERTEAIDRLRAVSEEVARQGANLLRATDVAYSHGLRMALRVMETAHCECAPEANCCHATARAALLELVSAAEAPRT